jgi:hypothetical protein
MTVEEFVVLKIVCYFWCIRISVSDILARLWGANAMLVHRPYDAWQTFSSSRQYYVALMR